MQAVKVLLTGCHGLLGQKVVATKPENVDLIGLDLQPSSPILDPEKYYSCDITKQAQVFNAVDAARPDCIINAAAYTNVDGAETERELCWNINVTGVENLVHAARKVKSKIVHISTDYIFDGKNGPYDEEAVPNPQGYYGRSKLAGENALRISDVPYAIARTMVLYGHEMSGRNNFVTWLIGELESSRPVRIVTDQLGNTTLADELAAGCWAIVEKEFTGIVNIAGREIIDRFSFARLVAEVFELDGTLINPVTTAELNQAAPRPLNSGLIVDKALQVLGIDLSDARGGLLKLKKQIAKQRI